MPRHTDTVHEASALDHRLAPYRERMFDERHRDLSRQLLGWLLEHCSCPDGGRRHAKDAYTAAAFEICCAPAAAPAAELLLLGKCAVVFYLGDDGIEGRAPELDTFVHYLHTGQTTGGDELTDCYISIIADLRHAGRDTTRLQTVIGDWIANMKTEQRVDLATLSTEQHRTIRRHTVFVFSYVVCRQTFRGLFFSPPIEEILRTSGFLELAWEMTAIANDMGSVERDASLSGSQIELNLVLHRIEETGDLGTAIRASIDLHNQKAEDFRRVAQTLIKHAHALREPRMIEYTELVRSTVDGNLQATRRLVWYRFPGAEKHLRQLHIIANQP